MRSLRLSLVSIALVFVALGSSAARADDVKVSREAMQATINYLIERPYKDVFQLVPALIQAAPVDPKPTVKPDVPDPKAEK